MHNGYKGNDNRPVIEIGLHHRNLKQNVIEVTEDKLTSTIEKYRDNLKSRGKWLAPISFGAPLWLTLSTTTFKSLPFASGDMIAGGVFVLALGLTTASIWLFFKDVTIKETKVSEVVNIVRGEDVKIGEPDEVPKINAEPKKKFVLSPANRAILENLKLMKPDQD